MENKCVALHISISTAQLKYATDWGSFVFAQEQTGYKYLVH